MKKELNRKEVEKDEGKSEKMNQFPKEEIQIIRNHKKKILKAQDQEEIEENNNKLIIRQI